MQYNVLTIFEACVAAVSALVSIVFAYISPTIWSLVFGALGGAATSMVASHFLLPDVRNRFFVSKTYAFQILSFGKWIFASSIVYFLSTNFDRLYLAKIIPLQLLGVYGIARTLSELLGALVQRLGSNVVFPFVSSHSHMERDELHAQLAPIRMSFLLLAGLGLSLFAAVADLAIRILYDQRYHAASWMLPILIVGAWFGILCNINESSLLGLGKPNYNVFGNGAKFGFLLIGLTVSVGRYGVLAGVVVVALGDLCRYFPLLIGQARERFSFGVQDVIATVVVFLLVAFWEWLRWVFGYGTSFDELPVEITPLLGTLREIWHSGPS